MDLLTKNQQVSRERVYCPQNQLNLFGSESQDEGQQLVEEIEERNEEEEETTDFNEYNVREQPWYSSFDCLIHHVSVCLKILISPDEK